MTFAPFSQEARGAGWEVGENFNGKKQLSPLPILHPLAEQEKDRLSEDRSFRLAGRASRLERDRPVLRCQDGS